MKKLILCLTTLALVTANAASYRVTLFQPSVVEGQELKPGDYKLELNDANVVLSKGKVSVSAKVKVENADSNFASTTVRYASAEGKNKIQEIRLGGTKTKLVFSN